MTRTSGTVNGRAKPAQSQYMAEPGCGFQSSVFGSLFPHFCQHLFNHRQYAKQSFRYDCKHADYPKHENQMDD
jgi:hypothetical protein